MSNFLIRNQLAHPAVKRGDADAGGEPEEAADEQQRPLGRRPVPELVVIPRRRPLPLPLRRRLDRHGAIELLIVLVLVLVLATPRPRSACGHAALEVAQETAHAPAAAGEPRGGGDGGLVRLDVGVVLMSRRTARRGAGRRRGPSVGSEERGVVVVAGGHGAGVASAVRGAAAASRSGGGRERGRERGRQSGEVDECEGGVSDCRFGSYTRRPATPTREVRRDRESEVPREHEHEHGTTAVMKQRQWPIDPTGRTDLRPARGALVVHWRALLAAATATPQRLNGVCELNGSEPGDSQASKRRSVQGPRYSFGVGVRALYRCTRDVVRGALKSWTLFSCILYFIYCWQKILPPT